MTLLIINYQLLVINWLMPFLHLSTLPDLWSANLKSKGQAENLHE